MRATIVDVTTTALVTQSDWTRTLLTPLRAPAWRTYLYFVLVSILAVLGVVFIFCAGLASGLLIVTLVGIPLLALVVMSGRAWNRLYRSLAEWSTSPSTLRRSSCGAPAGCRPSRPPLPTPWVGAVWGSWRCMRC